MVEGVGFDLGQVGGWLLEPTIQLINHIPAILPHEPISPHVRAGGTYFFKVNLATRGTDLLTREIGLLRSAYASVVAEHPLTCNAMVILPDHLHAVWTLPEGDADFSVRWKKIKATFSRHCPPVDVSDSKTRKGERGIWQRRFWEHCIRDDDDYAAHVDYCHWNPVKHGFVARAVDWPNSTVHREVKAGRFVA